MSITLNTTENKIFNFLKQVILEKTPNTTLRAAGGWIRDNLLGIKSNDIDIAVDNMTGEKFANLVSEYMVEHGLKRENITIVEANPDQSKHLATAMIRLFGLPIDFVNLRTETYATSRIPTMEMGTPEEDAKRRDLTINSLFYNINSGEIEDYVGGIHDLHARIARTPLDPVQTFLDDPLRILRTVRFAAKYGLKLDIALIEAANKTEVKEAFKNKISNERIWAELAGKKDGDKYKPGALIGPNPVRAVELLMELGLMEAVFDPTEEEVTELAKEIILSHEPQINFDCDQCEGKIDLVTGTERFYNINGIWMEVPKDFKIPTCTNCETTYLKTNDVKKLEKLLKARMVPWRTPQNNPHHAFDIFEHTLHVFKWFIQLTPQEIKNNNELYLIRNLSVLLHDIGKRYTVIHDVSKDGVSTSYHGHEYISAKIAHVVLTRLHAPTDLIKRITDLISIHLRPHILLENGRGRNYRRFVRDYPDWMHSIDMAIADNLGKQDFSDNEVKEEIQKYEELRCKIQQSMQWAGKSPDPKMAIPRPISGKDLLQLGIKQGPIFGKILEHIDELLLDKPEMSKEEALKIVLTFTA